MPSFALVSSFRRRRLSVFRLLTPGLCNGGAVVTPSDGTAASVRPVPQRRRRHAQPAGRLVLADGSGKLDHFRLVLFYVFVASSGVAISSRAPATSRWWPCSSNARATPSCWRRCPTQRPHRHWPPPRPSGNCSLNRSSSQRACSTSFRRSPCSGTIRCRAMFPQLARHRINDQMPAIPCKLTPLAVPATCSSTFVSDPSP